MPPIKTSSTAASKTKASVFLFHGSDSTAVKKAAQSTMEKLAPAEALNFETVNGQAESVDDAVRSIDELRGAILTIPFFGDGKLIWWKNVNFLDDGVIGRSATVKEALENLIPVLEKVDGQSVTLIASVLAIHKGRTFPKALLKIAESHAFDLPDLRREGIEEGLARIEQRCREAGLKPEPAAVERLYQALGMNMGALEVELEKLAIYLGGNDQPLTLETVRELVGGQVEVLIWDFCDAVLAGKAKLALTLLQQLIAQEESEVTILILLAGQIRLAALAAALREKQMLKLGFRGVDLTPEAQALLPKKKSGETISTYNLGQVAQKSKHQPASFWFKALDQLYLAQQQMISGRADKVRALELAVIDIATNAQVPSS